MKSESNLILQFVSLFRRDDDIQQSFVRVMLGGIVMAYLLIYDHHTNDLDHRLVIAAVVYFIMGILILASNFLMSGVQPIRRYAGMISDVVVITYAMVLGEGTTASFFGGYLWVSIANGLRYGRLFLYMTSIFSVLGFAVAIYLSEFWSNQPTLWAGLMVWLVLLPLYVSMLIKKYEKAVYEAKKANSAKSQFLANMSHELRTPLNAIIGYTEMLHEEAIEESRKETADDLEKVLYSSSHLLNLINGILDISKIEAGRMDIRYSLMDMQSTLQRIIDAFKPQLTKNNNTIALHYLSAESIIFTDEEVFTQVMLNLLGNAIKFTHDGAIQVTVNTLNDEGIKYLQINVEDTGIGIEEDKLESLFEPFVQADLSTTRKYGGTGLGLTLSRCFAEMLGGALTARSQYGEGSVFTVKLPISKEPEEEPKGCESIASQQAIVQS